MIKLGTKTSCIEVDMYELENLIREEYNNPLYSIVAAEELKNYTKQTYDIDFGEEIDEYELEEIEKFKSGNGIQQHITFALMQDMVNRKVIPAGEYLVDVSW